MDTAFCSPGIVPRVLYSNFVSTVARSMYCKFLEELKNISPGRPGADKRREFQSLVAWVSQPGAEQKEGGKSRYHEMKAN